MAKKKVQSEVIVAGGFDYSVVDATVAERVRTAAEKIRGHLKRTLEDIFGIGLTLLEARAALQHGQYGAWLKAEFGWTERTACNFTHVAERFGSKSEIISDLPIQPTAAYLLAAPSVPDEAREKAIERAQEGEKITTVIAREIVDESRQKGRRKGRKIATEKLVQRLSGVLEKYRKLWDTKELSEFARQLRSFADDLDKKAGAGKK